MAAKGSTLEMGRGKGLSKCSFAKKLPAPWQVKDTVPPCLAEHGITSVDELPTVSVLTPTCNRARFFPFWGRCLAFQDYPRSKVEVIVLDDSKDDDTATAVEAITPWLHPMNVRYIHPDKRKMIGKKRNMLNRIAHGDIRVNFDDDDYYGPERISRAVEALLFGPEEGRGGIAGGVAMFIYDTRTDMLKDRKSVV